MKSKRLLFLILVITAGILANSCSPEYIPNMINSPMLSNQGEIQATIAAGTSNLDLQTAYAITDNIAVMVNGSYADRTSDSTENFHKHLMIEGGIGYYRQISEVGRIEVFGGYGGGAVNGYYENDLVSANSDATFQRFFLQPGIGMSSGIFDGSFATRLSLVSMNPDLENFVPGLDPFLEPVVTAKLGWRYAKFVLQGGLSIPLAEENLTYDYQPFIINFGLNINIGRIYD